MFATVVTYIVLLVQMNPDYQPQVNLKELAKEIMKELNKTDIII